MIWALCLKITEKVSFNIAREASYVYIFSGQKFIKKGGKLVEIAKIGKFEWDILGNFQPMWLLLKLDISLAS